MRRLVLLGVLSGLVGVLLVATGAFAAPAPPAPTITGQPANPTTQTSATFAFTGQSGVMFQCKLDSGAFAACTSPKPYTGLAAGSHTFQVRAVAGGKTSGATSYTWSIDQVAPTVTSINRADASPSKANPLRFTVTFSEAVTGVGTGNVGLVTAGLGGTAPTIASVMPASGSATSFTVNVGTAGTTGGNSGSSIGLNLTAMSPIQDLAGNALGGSVPVLGQVYAFDTTAPVVALTKVNGAVVSFPFVTSAKVTSIGGTCGAAAGDLAQVAWSIGGKSGTSTCSSGAWSASLSINGNGSYTATASQSDQAGNSGSSGPKAVTVDKTAPTVSSINRTDANPTSVGPLHWTVAFSEPVSNVGTGNFGLVLSGISGSAPVIASAVAVGAAPAAAWTVTVTTAGTTGTNSGSIGLNLTAKGTIQDGAGNLLGGSVPVVGQVYAYATGSIEDFTITGSAVGLLYPGGPARPIAVTLHNPNDVPIYVTALTVAATTSTPAGCDHNDLVLVQADLTTATPNPYPNTVEVPANGSVTLPDQNVAAPTIRLQNRDFDQTPTCAGQTFSLSYTGSAHS